LTSRTSGRIVACLLWCGHPACQFLPLEPADVTESAVSTIRPARPADVPAMQTLINSFAADGLMLSRTLNELYENLRDFLVYTREGEVLGCVALHVIWGDLAEVKSLAVAPQLHGHGVGSDLVQAALEEARRLEIPHVFALTFRAHFFERLGFHCIDKHDLPQKIWGECIRCPKFPDCGEQAVKIHIA